MFESLKIWAVQTVESYGYAGIFLISYTESIAQPVPPDPFIAGGTALGLLGEPAVRRIVGEKHFVKGEALFNRFGAVAVFAAAVTPIPFKVVCWLAGIFEMRRTPFLIAAFAGRFPRFMMVAFMGDLFGDLL